MTARPTYRQAAVALLRDLAPGPYRDLAALTVCDYLDYLQVDRPSMDQLLDEAMAEQPPLDGMGGDA